MRFLSMIKVDEESGQKPSAQVLENMGRLMDELTRAGVLIDTAGLAPTSEGVRMHLARGGRITVTDGPFAETKEVIGGYAIFEVPSKEEAVALTRRFLEAHGEDWDIECELRPMMAPGECG